VDRVEFGCLSAPNFVDSESTSPFHNEVYELDIIFTIRFYIFHTCLNTKRR
jgi:hypothetical protein